MHDITESRMKGKSTDREEFKCYMIWHMMMAMLHSNGQLRTERDGDTEKGCKKPVVRQKTTDQMHLPWEYVGSCHGQYPKASPQSLPAPSVTRHSAVVGMFVHNYTTQVKCDHVSPVKIGSIYLFAHKTTIIVVTKVLVHELTERPINWHLQLSINTIDHYKSYKSLLQIIQFYTQHNKIQRMNEWMNQSVNQSY